MTPSARITGALLSLLAAAQAQAAPDPRPDAYNLLTHNAFFLTPLPFKFSWSNQERARLMIRADYLEERDLVIFNELFDNAASDILLNGLKDRYPHQTPVLGRSTAGWDATTGNPAANLEDGGVAIVSRWPIARRVQYLYRDACGADRLANKGFVYVKVLRGERPFHVIATHTQAADSACPDGGRAVRESQFREMRAFIDRENIPAHEVLFIGGDLNVIRGSDEYPHMLAQLDLREPDSYAGASATFDTRRNGVTGYQYPYKDNGPGKAPSNPPEYLDYILVSNRHGQVSYWHNQALDIPSPRWSASDGVNTWYYQDYSDHYPVAAFTYADPLRTPQQAYKPTDNRYARVVLRSLDNGNALRTGAKATNWVTVTGNGRDDASTFSLNAWDHFASFCVRNGDYVTLESRAYPGYFLTWYEHGAGKWGYYPAAGKPSRHLRVQIDNDQGQCLKDGDQVAFIDYSGQRPLPGHDYYLKIWPDGAWKDHLFLWGNAQDGSRFRVEVAPTAVHEDWRSKLRF